MSQLESVLVIPDTHVPFHDKRALNLVHKVAKANRVNHLIVLGDFWDMYSVSAHSKDPTRGRDLVAEIEEGKHELQRLSESCRGAKKVFIGGNHEDRLERYLRDKAPELHTVASFTRLVDFKSMGFSFVPYKRSYKLGKMRYTHDVGLAGKHAARKSAEAMGHNTVIGHVHSIDYSVYGTVEGETHVGISFGWLGDREAVDYMHIDRVSRSWSLGFGFGYVDTVTQYSHLSPIPILPNYSCVVNGKLFKV